MEDRKIRASEFDGVGHRLAVRELRLRCGIDDPITDIILLLGEGY